MPQAEEAGIFAGLDRVARAGEWIREHGGDLRRSPREKCDAVRKEGRLRDIVRHRQIVTPLDLEREWSLTEGNIFQGELSPDQLFFMRPVAGWAQYRTPVKGLYLCGAATHPGGGIMGAPGRNAARVILSES